MKNTFYASGCKSETARVSSQKGNRNFGTNKIYALFISQKGNFVNSHPRKMQLQKV